MSTSKIIGAIKCETQQRNTAEQEPKNEAVNKENDTWQVVNDGLFKLFIFQRKETRTLEEEENWGTSIQELQ